MKGTAYLLQGLLVSFWWLGLWVSDSFYQAFQFPGISSLAFNAFVAPDIAIIVVLSIVRAYKVRRDLELIILGGFAYAGLYCLCATISTGGGFLPTTMMLIGLGYNIFLVYSSRFFRESKSNHIGLNALKTIIQIICFWLITLILFPWIILNAFQIEPDTSQTIKFIAYALFLFASILGLFSAFVLVKHGEGTPLPADQTQKLVVSGPYQWVRNPMAVAGMGQGLAISLYFGSIHLLIYTFIGGIIWHAIVRPIEEKNMSSRFGSVYHNYKQNVGLWIPKFRKKYFHDK